MGSIASRDAAYGTKGNLVFSHFSRFFFFPSDAVNDATKTLVLLFFFFFVLSFVVSSLLTRTDVGLRLVLYWLGGFAAALDHAVCHRDEGSRAAMNENGPSSYVCARESLLQRSRDGRNWLVGGAQTELSFLPLSAFAFVAFKTFFSLCRCSCRSDSKLRQRDRQFAACRFARACLRLTGQCCRRQREKEAHNHPPRHRLQGKKARRRRHQAQASNNVETGGAAHLFANRLTLNLDHAMHLLAAAVISLERRSGLAPTKS